MAKRALDLALDLAFAECSLGKAHDQTHVEQLFDSWCSSKKDGSYHAKLRQPMFVC